MSTTTCLPPQPASAAHGSPAAEAAGAAVLALARAARSFVLYDAQNEAIPQLLEAWRDKSRAALEACGELALDVRPFELALRGEVIYRDDDRERSMAFKLFRDGVRRLTLLPEARWEDLLALLQIVALRYTAILQQEEDAVTLLRAAGLRGVKLVAVEGFQAAEERPEPDAPGAPRAEGAAPRAGWDTPLPRLPAPAPLAWREVPPEALAGIQAEEAGDGLTRSALALARDLLGEAVRGQWPQPNRDLLQFFVELRDALLAEGRLEALRRLVDLIGEAGAGQLRHELLGGLSDPRTLDLVLAGLPAGATELPPGLLALVPLLGLATVLDRLASERGEQRRALLLQIVLARLPREADAVLRRLPGLEPALARALATGLVQRCPERATEVARLLLQQGDDDLRIEGLEALARAPGEVRVAPVATLLDDRSEAVRVKAAEVLGRRGDETALAPLLAALESGERTPREAEAIGQALAGVAPIHASRLFAAWLHPKTRFLVGPSAQQKRFQWAAVAGMASVPGAEVERQLLALAQEADEELRKHCLAALGRRRKGGGRG